MISAGIRDILTAPTIPAANPALGPLGEEIVP